MIKFVDAKIIEKLSLINSPPKVDSKVAIQTGMCFNLCLRLTAFIQLMNCGITINIITTQKCSNSAKVS